jgi:hypothetical protein
MLVRCKDIKYFISLGANPITDILKHTSEQLKTAAFFRIQGLFLAKYFYMIKESDSNRNYVKQLGLSY